MYGSCHSHGHRREKMRAAWRAFAETQLEAARGRRGGGAEDERGGWGWGGGFGRFGGPRGGRPLGHGDLRLLLLALIGEKPRHGYDLIKAIEERFAGGYAPSPGAVYPTLTMLEEQDLIRGETSDGAKKLFTITPEGEAYLKENRTAVDGIMSRIDLAAAAYASHATPESVREAMKTLHQSLHMRRGPWNDAEAERVKALIEKTARDIVGLGST